MPSLRKLSFASSSASAAAGAAAAFGQDPAESDAGAASAKESGSSLLPPVPEAASGQVADAHEEPKPADVPMAELPKTPVTAPSSDVPMVELEPTPKAASGQEAPVEKDQDKAKQQEEFVPSASMEAEVMAPDSEEIRLQNLEKLKDMVSSLSELDKSLRTLLTPKQSPREQMAAASSEPVAADDDVDWGDEEEEEEDVAAGPVVEGAPALSEEVARLLELMGEQQQFLQKMLDHAAERQEKEEQASTRDWLLQNIMSGGQAESLRVIASLRPNDLRDIRDLAGMTVLHWAVRVADREVVQQILSRAPDLANIPTHLQRQPPGWTPLMILADKPPKEFDNSMALALCASMSAEGLNVRSGTYATATHLAAARGNLLLLKRILWRMNELGGRDLVVAHLKMRNQMETCPRKMSSA